jgi:hypothetical protein
MITKISIQVYALVLIFAVTPCASITFSLDLSPGVTPTVPQALVVPPGETLQTLGSGSPAVIRASGSFPKGQSLIQHIGDHLNRCNQALETDDK